MAPSLPEWDSALAAQLMCRPFIHIPGPNPILTPGPTGAWDDRIIEAADITKDHDTYYLYYHGASAKASYQLGVATASHPLGPWTKHPANPIIRNFGYVGGVVKVGSRFHMYNEHPIGASGPDFGD